MHVPLASFGEIHHNRKSAISKRSNEYLFLPVFQFSSEDIERRSDATMKWGSREHAIQDVSQYCRPGPVACIRAGSAGDGFEPLSPQNSTGNRILRASNDNLASAASS